jgi:hypothetical protein
MIVNEIELETKVIPIAFDPACEEAVTVPIRGAGGSHSASPASPRERLHPAANSVAEDGIRVTNFAVLQLMRAREQRNYLFQQRLLAGGPSNRQLVKTTLSFH